MNPRETPPLPSSESPPLQSEIRVAHFHGFYIPPLVPHRFFVDAVSLSF